MLDESLKAQMDKAMAEFARHSPDDPACICPSCQRKHWSGYTEPLMRVMNSVLFDDTTRPPPEPKPVRVRLIEPKRLPYYPAE